MGTNHVGDVVTGANLGDPLYCEAPHSRVIAATRPGRGRRRAMAAAAARSRMSSGTDRQRRRSPRRALRRRCRPGRPASRPSMSVNNPATAAAEVSTPIGAQACVGHAANGCAADDRRESDDRCRGRRYGLADPGTARIGPMLTTGLDGGRSTMSAAAMASRTPGPALRSRRRRSTMRSAGTAACSRTHHSWKWMAARSGHRSATDRRRRRASRPVVGHRQ